MEATETSQPQQPEQSEGSEPESKGNGKASSVVDPKTGLSVPANLTPAEKAKIRFKSKIGGVEQDVELDEDQIQRDYQKWKASEQRFDEANKLNKRNEAFLAKMKSKDGVAEVLRAFGHDPRQMSEEFLADVLRFEMLSPEQRKIIELEKQIAQATREKKEYDERMAAEKDKAESDRIASGLQSEIIDILEKNQLPKNSETVWRIARQLRIHWERGIDASPSDVVPIVSREMEMNYRPIYESLSESNPAKLEQMLGEKVVNALLKYSLSKIKNPVNAIKKPKSDNFFAPKAKKKGFISEKEMGNYMEKIRESKN